MTTLLLAAALGVLPVSIEVRGSVTFAADVVPTNTPPAYDLRVPRPPSDAATTYRLVVGEIDQVRALRLRLGREVLVRGYLGERAGQPYLFVTAISDPEERR